MNSQTMSLSDRFIGAYNLLDHCLRVQYNFKTNLSFSDLIRRCTFLNQVIRAYEDDLIHLARLRNAIIHSRSNEVIAEPHEDVVELMEKIARIISTPPLAIDVIKRRDVYTIKSEVTLGELSVETHRLGYSNIPVYKANTLIGVIRWSAVAVALGQVISGGQSVDDFLKKTTLETFLRDYPDNTHFCIASTQITIEETLKLFNQNRKLLSIIITSDGTASGTLTGIITSGDVIELMHTLEGF